MEFEIDGGYIPIYFECDTNKNEGFYLSQTAREVLKSLIMENKEDEYRYMKLKIQNTGFTKNYIIEESEDEKNYIGNRIIRVLIRI